MRQTNVVAGLSILGLIAALGCERSTYEDDPSTSDSGATPAEAGPTERATADDDGQEPSVITADLKPTPTPSGWRTVSAKSPREADVSIAVPEAWVGRPVPNSATLFDLVAPAGGPDAGAAITGIALPFKGPLDKLVQYNRSRLRSFATIHEDGVIRFGDSDAWEVAASWTDASETKDTVQLLLATGEEGVSVLCVKGPAMEHDQLRPFCEKLFATLTVTAAPKAE